ncbi:3-oxoacyl-reductase [Exophiala viscosa]|uniref:3-oxoacyl-reductase n=1 Tax=Exophiala viscosa TaxID=2486360 RepID=A0AAN6IBX7_9EURO|nr:3-oxoacyl-reductase [Exophiala viscosa]
MDPKQFGSSTLPYRHEPTGPLADECLVGANKGRLAVVTGAGRGIGQAIAIALAKSSANVAILDLSVESQEETKLACQKFEGVKVEAYKCDITDVQAVRATFAAIDRAFGPVDILVNNAGVAHGKLAFEETFENFWKAIEINFKGTMLCIYEVLQSMRERKSGCIINMASRAATVDMPGGVSYNSSKAAVVRATASLQEEFEQEGLGQNLHTYCLHPGGVWGAMVTENTTPEVQQQIRPIFKDVPELCGNTIAYLASGRAKELRGHYFDCRQEIERVCSFGYKTLRDYGLYNLGVKFLPGYENEP